VISNVAESDQANGFHHRSQSSNSWLPMAQAICPWKPSRGIEMSNRNDHNAPAQSCETLGSSIPGS